MIVNETVDKLVEDEMKQAANNVEFIRDCIGLPSFAKLSEEHQEYTRRSLEVSEKRFEQLEYYFSSREKTRVQLPDE